MASALPYWPALLRRKDACAYLSLTVAQFEAAMNEGNLPLPTRDLAGVELWSRRKLDEAVETLQGGKRNVWAEIGLDDAA